jgi:hypothetical protein
MIIKFNNSNVYINENSFIQNYKISKELRLDVKLELDCNNIVSIGGESYLFGLTNENITYIINYTNSKYIFDDAILNNKIYNKYLQNYLIDYNIYTKFKNAGILIINLAKLNINLLNNINKRYYKKIIIINCHHDEFWKRIKLLTNYKLITRKQYIANNNFITVNILEYKYSIPIFIPIGNNCSVAYQLRKLNIRYNSYPFDWAKSNIKKLNRVLENNFIDYSKLRIHKYSNNHLDNIHNIHGTYILKNSYNINFAHELLDINDLNKLEYLFEKRINKFKKCKNNYIIFILLNLEINIDYELDLLIHNLKKYFNNFKILYISNYKIKENEYIIQYNIDNYWVDWKFNNLNWDDIIFNNL